MMRCAKRLICLLQVDSFESYGNNTMKSILALKYFLGLDWSILNRNGKPPRFMFRVDDDIYINVPAVDNMVLKNTQWYVYSYLSFYGESVKRRLH